MGITGTDVSKEAAVMILTDDNFATIVKAVELGRALYDSLVKYIDFQMARLFGFILLFLGAALFNILGGIPFLPFQTLWINFTVDLFLAIGIGLGKPSSGLMERAPRSSQAQLLPRPLLIGLAGLGLVIAVSSLAVMQWGTLIGLDQTVARTMGFVTFCLAGIFLALEVNDDRHSLFGAATLENGKLLQMSLYALVATILVTEIGILQRIFDTASLSASQWVICLVVASAIIWVAEVAKLVLRRRDASAAATAEPSAGQPSAPASDYAPVSSV
jgi:Ca2+-transporting ATPase